MRKIIRIIAFETIRFQAIINTNKSIFINKNNLFILRKTSNKEPRSYTKI